MKSRSLWLRLTVAAIVSLSVALGIAGFGLVELFGRHVERRIGLELDTYLDQITAAVPSDSSLNWAAALQLADPRFDQPLSGLYWQLRDETSGTLERSRSLWDTELALPADEPAIGATHAHEIAGPRGTRLLVHERRVGLDTVDGARVLRVAAAIDLAELRAAETAFATDVAPSLAVLGLVLFAAAMAQIIVGLKPLTDLREAVAMIRRGAAARLSGKFPAEVMPLVEEVNTLLVEREAATARARAQAADLAHGLKTPLTALGADTRKLRELGQGGIADEIDAISVAMRRHVDRQLARAKAGMGLGTRPTSDVKAVVDRLVAVMRKTPSGDPLHWIVDISGTPQAAIDPDDMTEILGNLLENAARYALTRVVITAAAAAGGVRITIDDDGPGIPPQERDKVLHRGGRLDAQAPGAGIGLAVAGDLLEMWGGTLRLDAAPVGGLRVDVELPARDKAS